MTKRHPLIQKAGFTLIELLIVIAIIGLLATLSTISFGEAQKKARDSRRLSDMAQIRKALELYKNEYGYYPANTDNDASGWDVGYLKNGGDTDPFIEPLKTSGIMPIVGRDPIGSATNTSPYYNYRYYRYAAGSSGCDATRGDFYVLGISYFETISGSLSVNHPSSPGWACPSRDWSLEFQYVTGNFTN